MLSQGPPAGGNIGGRAQKIQGLQDRVVLLTGHEHHGRSVWAGDDERLVAIADG